MAIEKEINIKVNTSKAVEGVKSLNKEIKGTEDNLKGVTSVADSFTGGMLSKFSSLTDTLGGVAKGFKGIGAAIAASGLGLLVLVISSVIAAFKSSEEGEDKFAKGMAMIGGITDKLIDTLAALGEIIIAVFENPKKAIKDFANLIKENIVNRLNGLLELIPNLGKAISLLFEGKFKEAAKVATDAAAKVALGVDGITDKVNKAVVATQAYIKELEKQAKIAGQIADARDKAEDIERDLIVKRAEADRQIAELREKAAQRDQFNLKQRISFLQEAQSIENKITSQEIEAAKLKRDAKILENKQTRSNTAALEEEQKLKAEVIKLETARLNANRALTRQVQTLRAEENADLKTKLDEQLKLNEQYWKDYAQSLKEARDLQIEEEKSFNETLKELRKENKSELDQQFLNFIEADEQARQIELNARQSFEDAKYNIANQGLDLIASLAGKSKGIATTLLLVEKGLAISQVVTNASRAIAQATANLAAVPAFIGTVPNPAYAAQAVATAKGIATTKLSAGISIAQILAQTIGKLSSSSSLGGGSSSGGGGGGVSAPSFNLVQGTGTNQIAEGLATQRRPLQAYVVASNVTSAQALDRNIVNGASI